MSTGKVFRRENLIAPEQIAPAGMPQPDEDMLGKLNSVISNIDKLLGDVLAMKEKHPELLNKFSLLRGSGQPTSPYQGQFSPTNQPGETASPGIDKQAVAGRVYTFLIGSLHQLEGKGLTVDQLKSLFVSNRDDITKAIEKIL